MSLTTVKVGECVAWSQRSDVVSPHCMANTGLCDEWRSGCVPLVTIGLVALSKFLQRWRNQMCECPRGQTEQRDLEISPRFVKNGRDDLTFRSEAIHVFQ